MKLFYTRLCEIPVSEADKIDDTGERRKDPGVYSRKRNLWGKGGGLCDSEKGSREGGGYVVCLKCRRVCRIFGNKRRSRCIVEKEIYGGGGGGGFGGRQNLIWGIGAVDTKNARCGMSEEG